MSQKCPFNNTISYTYTKNSNYAQCQYLNQRGMHQATRNNSQQIWALFCQDSYDLRMIRGYCQYCKNKGKCQICGGILQRTNGSISYNTNQNQGDNDNKIRDKYKESLNIKNSQNYQETLGTTKPQTQFVRSKNNGARVSFMDPNFNQNQSKQNSLSKGKSKSKSKPKIYDKTKYRKYKKSIEKYINDMKPYSRQMPHSAFRLFFQRPCPQNYGGKNTNAVQAGFIYNNYLKSHNVQPHLGQNKPKKYQTYQSALNFAKRCKVDPDQRLLRIYRQITKNLGVKSVIDQYADGLIDVQQENSGQILKVNISSLKGNKFQRSKSLQIISQQQQYKQRQKLSSSKGSNLQTTMQTNQYNLNNSNNRDLSFNNNQQEKRLNGSKSLSSIINRKSYRQPFYIYKYKDKDGDIHYAKDRHGLTCYVDPSFSENQQALTKFAKSRRPIQADDVKPSDQNIDRIRIQNYLQTKAKEGTQQQYPRHYLKPVVDEPVYCPEKYSFKRKNKNQNKNTNKMLGSVVDRIKQEA